MLQVACAPFDPACYSKPQALNFTCLGLLTRFPLDGSLVPSAMACLDFPSSNQVAHFSSTDETAGSSCWCCCLPGCLAAGCPSSTAAIYAYRVFTVHDIGDQYVAIVINALLFYGNNLFGYFSSDTPLSFCCLNVFHSGTVCLFLPVFNDIFPLCVSPEGEKKKIHETWRTCCRMRLKKNKSSRKRERVQPESGRSARPGRSPGGFRGGRPGPGPTAVPYSGEPPDSRGAQPTR